MELSVQQCYRLPFNNRTFGFDSGRQQSGTVAGQPVYEHFQRQFLTGGKQFSGCLQSEPGESPYFFLFRFRISDYLPDEYVIGPISGIVNGRDDIPFFSV